MEKLIISRPNPNKYPEVDHIDSNSLNDKLINLKWSSHIDNCNNPNTLIKRSR